MAEPSTDAAPLDALPIGTSPLVLRLGDGSTVSALADAPAAPWAAYTFAHGAGAGMTHPFMAGFARRLAGRGIAVLRYQFPSMERGARRPDPPPVAQATVRAAVDAARARWPALPLVSGGKSFGGRMTSQAEAAAPLPGVRGLAFLGFPLHPAGKPSDTRAAHLADVKLPMLFLQGEADRLAEPAWLLPLIERLAPRATLVSVPQADHSFHVPLRSGRRDDEVLDTLAGRFEAWARALPAGDAGDDMGRDAGRDDPAAGTEPPR